MDVFRQWKKRWFPAIKNQEEVRRRLADFYATRDDYHAMTDGSGKESHPHVQLLLSLVKPGDVCVEFGCGGGTVVAELAPRVREAVGLDVAPPALARARDRVEAMSNVRLVETDVADVPLADGVADVVYSFEVLEHVWHPEAVLQEMIRVVRPGGMVFFTAPNGFSLDLHLKKRVLARVLDVSGAVAVWLRSLMSHRVVYHIEPDLDVPEVYPDCDMISTFYPARLAGYLESNRCSIERLETFFFQVEGAEGQAAREHFSRLECNWFYKNFGDHLLCVARRA